MEKDTIITRTPLPPKVSVRAEPPVRTMSMDKAKRLTEREVQRNMRSVAHAIAQQELEGLKVSDATVADLNRAARGEIDTDEVIRNIHSRLLAFPALCAGRS